MLERDVALKLPHGIDSEEMGKRLLREAQAAGKLRHPNIVPTYDAGFVGKQFYIASAFVDGQTLAQATASDDLDRAQRVEIVRKLAEALSYAHAQGIVHRDIKPHNVMLDADGEPHLMDFGLAQLQDAREQLTHDGVLLGTPAYISPEQAKRDKSSVGPATDQYSLGVILYELLCGERPFEGPLEVVLYRVQKADPKPPRAIDATIPRDLETICLKALSKDAAARYADCQELADDLLRWKQYKPIRARRVGPLERLARWSRREPMVAGLSAALLVVLVVGLAVSLTLAAASRRSQRLAERTAAEAQRNAAQAEENARQAALNAKLAEQKTSEAEQSARRAEQSAQQAERNKLLAEEKTRKAEEHLEQRERAKQQAEEALKRASGNIYLSQLRTAEREWRAGRWQRAKSWLDKCASDYRNWEWGFLRRRCEGQFVTLSGHEKRVTHVVAAADGVHLATASADRTIRIWDATTGKEVFQLSTEANTLTALAVGPQTKRVALASADRGVVVHHLGPGGRAVSLPDMGGIVFQLAFSPDGKYLATSGHLQPLRLWHAEDGTSERTIPAAGRTIAELVFSSDGRYLAAATGQAATRQKEVLIWELSGASDQAVTTLRLKHSLSGLAFSPMGPLLAGTTSAGNLHIWDATTGREKLTIDAGLGSLSHPAFSADGRLVAAAGSDRSVRLWEVDSGARRFAIPRRSGEVFDVTFAETGLRITSMSAASRNRLEIWTAKASQHAPPAAADSPAEFRPGVAIFSVATSAAAESLFDALRGVRPPADASQPPSTKTRPITFVAYSPNGRRIVSGAKVAQRNSRQLTIWDAASGAILFTCECAARNQGGEPPVLAFSPDGRNIALFTTDRLLETVDLEDGKVLATMKAKDNIRCLAYSPDGRYLAAGTDAGELEIRDTETAEVSSRQKVGEAILCLAYSPDGQHIATAGVVSSGTERRLTIRESNGGIVQVLADLSSLPDSITYSAGGRWLLVKDFNGIQIWNAQTGEHRYEWWPDPPAGNVACIARSADGQQIAYASHRGDMWAVEMSHVSGGQAPLRRVPTAVTSLAFHPQGSRFVAGCADGTLRIWDTIVLEPVAVWDEKPPAVTSSALVPQSPDGRHLVLGDNDGSLIIKDVETNRIVRKLGEHTSAVTCVVYSPTGESIVSGHRDGEIIIWNAGTGDRVATLEGHQAPITSLAYRPDGTRIASGSDDHTVSVWEAITGQEIIVLRGHTAPIRNVAFSSDGGRIISQSSKNVIRVWEGSPVEPDPAAGRSRDVESPGEADTASLATEEAASGSAAGAAAHGGANPRQAQPANGDSEENSPSAQPGSSAKTQSTAETIWSEIDSTGDGMQQFDQLLERLRGSGKPKLAETLQKDLVDAKNEVARGGEAFIIFGQVVLDGQENPAEVVVSQSRIRDEGYFVFAVSDRQRPVYFRSIKHLPYALHLENTHGSVSSVGPIRLTKVPPEKECKLVGKLVLPDGMPASTGRVYLYPRVVYAEINRPTGGYNNQNDLKSRTWEGSVAATGSGAAGSVEFAFDSLAPSAYYLWIGWDGCVGVPRRFTLESGTFDLGTIELERPIEFRIRYAITLEPRFTKRTVRQAIVHGGDFWKPDRRNLPGSPDGALRFGQYRGKLVVNPFMGPSESVDLGQGKLEDFLGRDLSDVSFDSAGALPLLDGHVYLSWQNSPKLWILLEAQVPGQSPPNAERASTNGSNEENSPRAQPGSPAEADTPENAKSQADDAYSRGEWALALEHYTAAIARGQRDWASYRKQAHALAALGRWREAADKFDALIAYKEQDTDELGPYIYTSTQWMYQAAALAKLADGDLAGYRAACKTLVGKFGEVASPIDAFMLAATCGFGRDAVEDWEAVLAAAQRAVDAQPANPVAQTTMGAVLYRAGRTDEAQAMLEKALPVHALAKLTPEGREMVDILELSRAMCLTFLAMIYHDRNDQQKLATTLGDAGKQLQVLQKIDSQAGHPYTLFPWLVRFGIEVTRRELGDLEAAPLEQQGG